MTEQLHFHFHTVTYPIMIDIKITSIFDHLHFYACFLVHTKHIPHWGLNLGVESLSHMILVSSNLLDYATVFSKVDVPIHISSSSAREFLRA